MPRRNRWMTSPAIALLILAGFAAEAHSQTTVAQEAVDLDVVQRIRQEGFQRSQLPELARHLTDVIGPRLTGSPGMRRANDWSAETFSAWGLQDVTVEPWGDFGRGWERVSYSGQILTPFAQPLVAQPVAWTGSTDGAVRGQVVTLVADSAADLARFEGTLGGAIVLFGAPSDIEPEFEIREDRRTSLDELLNPGDQPARSYFMGPDGEARLAAYRARRAISVRAQQMAKEEGAAAILRPSRFQYGVLSSVNGDRDGRTPGAPEPLPQLIVAPEQYNTMIRNLAAGIPVEVELDIQNRFFEDDIQAYNTLADLPGSDLSDEFVMIGAHLDSWHMGTGATDNAAGSVVMMEAMRILKALDLEPRRTIRIALWSGEEQGLYGSARWLQNHPEMHDRISAYLNVDNGTGKIRGIWDQSNEAAIPVFEQTLWPFRDLGVVAVRHGNTGGTDHLSFDELGIPGFNFIQDPIEYSLRTHHTDLDTFDHLLLDDLRQAAVVVAFTAYQLAMRDEMMPRKRGPAATQ